MDALTIHPIPTAAMTRDAFRAMLAALPEDNPGGLHAAIVSAAEPQESGR